MEKGFASTCWTDVLATCDDTEAASEAFGRIYRDYRGPLENYIRRRGFRGDVEDLAQAFFSDLFVHQRLSGLIRSAGRFRSFLLVALQNFLTNEWHKQCAKKRGGGAEVVPFDVEFKTQDAPAHPSTPDALYDRDWAFLMLDRSMARLRWEFEQAGKAALFERFKPFLHRDGMDLPTSRYAAEAELSEGAFKTALHRFRKRYGKILRAEIGRTLGPDENVQTELRYLVEVVCQAGGV